MRRGFTLLEVVLVLVIMAIAAALAVPVIQTMLDDAHMNAGADQLQARLADARAKALETGVPWKLAYLPNSSTYKFAAEDSDAWSSSDNTVKETQDYICGELPKDIVMAINRDDIAGAAGTPQGSGTWQTLAVFLGDGGARDDGTVYIGKAGIMPLRLRVRGLTGAVVLETPMVVKDNP